MVLLIFLAAKVQKKIDTSRVARVKSGKTTRKKKDPKNTAEPTLSVLFVFIVPQKSQKSQKYATQRLS